MAKKYDGLEDGLRALEARKEIKRLARQHGRSNEHVRREDLRHRILRESRHLQ